MLQLIWQNSSDWRSVKDIISWGSFICSIIFQSVKVNINFTLQLFLRIRLSAKGLVSRPLLLSDISLEDFISSESISSTIKSPLDVINRALLLLRRKRICRSLADCVLRSKVRTERKRLWHLTFIASHPRWVNFLRSRNIAITRIFISDDIGLMNVKTLVVLN